MAFSGGPDSLALLHATVRAARPAGLQVLALHVHHGLLPEADRWLHSARRLCARWHAAGWPVELCWRRLEGAPARGESIEAWARRGRHAALTAMAHEAGASLILLAQHRRDQAETVLLQALRGAGPRGLAAMPACFDQDGLTWARPWLARSRDAINAYIRRHRLKPVDDPSNADPRLARSRLRHQVWPALVQAFGDAETTLSEAARRAAEADAALAELATLDLHQVANVDGLQRHPWLLLSPARRLNALRAWLGHHLAQGAPQRLVDRLMAEWPRQANGQWPVGQGVSLTSYRGCLRLARASAAPGPCQRVDLSHPGVTAVSAWAGCWQVETVAQGGIAARGLAQAEMRPRDERARFQRAPGTPPRSLKKQYQLAAVAPDHRTGPTLWIGGQLAFVPGLGIDARAVAPPGEPQCRLQWCPDPG